MKITILIDNNKSWYIKYGNILNDRLLILGYDSSLIWRKEDIKVGDVCFLLSCTKILPEEYLSKNKYNIVIHASDLPKGKGFSPLQWQILEGKNDIVLTLFNAIKELDAGEYFFKETIYFEGHELLNELHEKIGLKINEMAETFIIHSDKLNPIKQIGESTYYRKRNKSDDELDPQKSLIELFNHFRIANNEEYPLFFEYQGYRYNLKIEKRNE